LVEESVCLVTRIGWGFKYAPAEYYVCLNDPKTEGLKVVISAFPPMAIYEHVRGLEGRIDKVILLFDFPKMSRVRTKDIYENPSEFLKDFERAIKEGAHAGSINVPEDIEIPPERVLYRIYGGPEDKDITVRYYKSLVEEDITRSLQLSSLEKFINVIEKDGVRFIAIKVPIEVASIGSLSIKTSWESLYKNLRGILSNGHWRVYYDVTLGIRVIVEPLFDILRYLRGLGVVSEIMMCYAFWSLRDSKATVVVVRDYEDLFDTARKIADEILNFNVTFESYKKLKEILDNTSHQLNDLRNVIEDVINDLIVRDLPDLLVKVTIDLRKEIKKLMKNLPRDHSLSTHDVILLDIAGTFNNLVDEKLIDTMEVIKRLNSLYARASRSSHSPIIPRLSGYTIYMSKEILKKIADKSATYDFVTYVYELFNIAVFSGAYWKLVFECNEASLEERAMLVYPDLFLGKPLYLYYLNNISKATQKGLTEDYVKKTFRDKPLSSKERETLQGKIIKSQEALEEIVHRIRSAGEKYKEVLEDMLLKNIFSLKGPENFKYFVRNTVIKFILDHKDTNIGRKIYEFSKEIRTIRHVIAHGGFHSAGDVKKTLKGCSPMEYKEELIRKFDDVLNSIVKMIQDLEFYLLG